MAEKTINNEVLPTTPQRGLNIVKVYSDSAAEW